MVGVLYYIVRCNGCNKDYAIYAHDGSVAFYFDANNPQADVLLSVKPAALICPYDHPSSDLVVLSKAAAPIDVDGRVKWLYVDKKPVRV